MISQPGDKRAALIAALISIPAACLIGMLIHYFVPTDMPTSTVAVVEKAPMPGPRPKGMFKPFEPDAKVSALLKEKTVLAAKKLTLIKNAPADKACPALLNKAAAELLLAEAAHYRYTNGIRPRGAAPADLAVKLVYARKAAEQISAMPPKKDCCPVKKLDCRSELLDLEIQFASARITRNPEFMEAFAAFGKNPGIETLVPLINAERMPRRH